ncbi:cytochrome c [Nitratireductor mangrovi]|uniref:Cytochrome c n=1 Tax=Nitratireductor mangrovi TaxID=2599600 RepID=A0A5B8L017_9HYPH|nr:cytochrome c [Nitratireductor mangrovi]QDZ01354.1 cytochrome c [Nitratireductor mangrovi]
MTTTKTIATTVTLLLAGFSALAGERDYGPAEYQNSCAACHGENGQGDGPRSADLAAPPSDLTGLARDNGGEYPYWKVFWVIDGRYVVPLHNDGEMPVWGEVFKEGDIETFGPIGGELIARERVHRLTEFIETLQR